MIKEIMNFIETITNKILSIVNIMSNDFDLALWVLEKFPILGTYITYNQIVILTTIISGLTVTFMIYKAMITISKRTLNFAFFAQWAIILTIIAGIIYDVAKILI